MTSFDLRRLKLHTGEERRETVEIAFEPFFFGGQRYDVVPPEVPAELRISRTTGGLLFELRLRVRIEGPCMRCLADAGLDVPIHGREYQADRPGGDEELMTPYLVDGALELTAWARDAVALELPDKILCRPDCAGLCPVCGRDLNVEPHGHEDDQSDPRWAALAELRDRL